MFIRRIAAKGREYFAVVEGWRDEFGRVNQRMVMWLGKSPTLRHARKAARAQIAADRKLRTLVLREVRATTGRSRASSAAASKAASLPQWAKRLLNSLDARIAENERRLKKLAEIEEQMTADR